MTPTEHLESDSTGGDSTATSDRRRRPRLPGTTPGWVMPDGSHVCEPWEVRVNDVSRQGVGFESAEEFQTGQIIRIRIGRGPLELARRVRIVRCNRVGRGGTFSVGGEFL
jgi:hypothetical protein